MPRRPLRALALAPLAVALACSITDPHPIVDEDERNNSMSSAQLVDPNTTIRGSLGFFDGVDWFKIHVSTPGIVTVRLTSTGVDVQTPDLRIMNNDTVGS